MDIKKLANLLNSKKKEIEALMRRKLLVIVGRMAKDHFQDNFRKGGFLNGGLHKWPVSKRQQSGTGRANSQYGPLLSSRNHLFSSIKYVPSDFSVTVSNDLPYAPVHNWGGYIHPTVTPRLRRFAWAMYYNAQGIKKRAVEGKRKPKKGRSAPVAEPPQAQFWKRMALTRKRKLNIRIPQRQFMGESRELRQRVNERIEKELSKILEL